MHLNRAYSVLSIKSIDEERRTFTGTASTPMMDFAGDVVEPLGLEFTNPTPLLMFHDTERPVGHVMFHPPTAKGLNFTATIPLITEVGTLKNRVDEAWHSVKSRLIGAVSVRLAAKVDWVKPLKGGGIHWLRSRIKELSLVTLGANAEATIANIKSLDSGFAATGTESEIDRLRLISPGASGSLRVVHVTTKDQKMPKTVAERVKELEATRQAKHGEMTAIDEKVAADGTTKDPAQRQRFDELADEIKSLDAEIVDQRTLEEINKAAAMPVKGDTAKAASDARAGVISLKQTVPAGTSFTRYAMALAAGRGSRLEAVEYAKRWESSTPEVAMVLKAAVTAGTTTDSDWAAPLVVYQNMASEFIELLRPATIIGRIPGLRRVPFNVTMPRQTQGATAGWVGQGAPKPVSELKFDQVSLGMAKAAGIIVLSEELVRSSNPSAEAIVRADMIATIAQFLDQQFVDPSVAAVANVSPASITNGVTPIPSTGTTFAAMVTDIKSLFAAFTAANMSLAGSVWLMTETQAQALSMNLNALGQPSIPGITILGGTMFGLPVITSENIPLDGGSPEGSRIILIKAPDVLLADDGGVTLDVSREASLQMDSAPDNPGTASTVMVSLWQNNLVGLRAERFINWLKRRSTAVGYINGANYV